MTIYVTSYQQPSSSKYSFVIIHCLLYGHILRLLHENTTHWVALRWLNSIIQLILTLKHLTGRLRFFMDYLCSVGSLASVVPCPIQCCPESCLYPSVKLNSRWLFKKRRLQPGIYFMLQRRRAKQNSTADLSLIHDAPDLNDNSRSDNSSFFNETLIERSRRIVFISSISIWETAD